MRYDDEHVFAELLVRSLSDEIIPMCRYLLNPAASHCLSVLFRTAVKRRSQPRCKQCVLPCVLSGSLIHPGKLVIPVLVLRPWFRRSGVWCVCTVPEVCQGSFTLDWVDPEIRHDYRMAFLPLSNNVVIL